MLLLNSLITCDSRSVGTLWEGMNYEEYSLCLHTVIVLPLPSHFYTSNFFLPSCCLSNTVSDQQLCRSALRPLPDCLQECFTWLPIRCDTRFEACV